MQIRVKTASPADMKTLFDGLLVPSEDRPLVPLNQEVRLPARFSMFASQRGIIIYHPALRREAEEIYAGLCGAIQQSDREGTLMRLAELARLRDRDRALRNMELAHRYNLPVEYAGLFPVTGQPFEISYEGNRWSVEPLGESTPTVPDKVLRILEREEEAGLQIDEFWVAHELTLEDWNHMPQRNRKNLWGVGPALANAALVGAKTVGVRVAAIGSSLVSLALDPAIVGVCRSGPVEGQAMILVRWG